MRATRRNRLQTRRLLGVQAYLGASVPLSEVIGLLGALVLIG